MIKIRPAKEADAATILRFIRELARYEKAEHEVKADKGPCVILCSLRMQRLMP